MKGDTNLAVSSPESGITPNKENFREEFESGAETRQIVAKEIEMLLEQAFSSLDYPPTIKVRAKKFASYYRKYLSLLKAGIAEPNITDLIGIRIVCPFIEELVIVEDLVKEHFEVVEIDRKGHYSFREFGYESTHL